MIARITRHIVTADLIRVNMASSFLLFC
jgi:hypothetical protein